jgi:AcrR family transcriptional regulator
VKTRDRILEQALILFNEQGVGRVSLNQVALELGISSGNLHYHFKTRAQLIARLLTRFDNEVTAVTTNPHEQIAGLDDFWMYLHLLMEICLRYRFILRDIDRIFAETDEAKKKLVAIRGEIERSMSSACGAMRDAGVIRVGVGELDGLALHLAFVVCCWPTFEMLSSRTPDSMQGPVIAALQARSLLAPFLDGTQKGYLDYLRGKYLEHSSAIRNGMLLP